jgi:hypothetical protein
MVQETYARQGRVAGELVDRGGALGQQLDTAQLGGSCDGRMLLGRGAPRR